MSRHDIWPVAIIGSGNIGTDLMIKILRSDGPLTVGAMVGIDPASDGLARAARMGVPTTADGVAGLLAMSNFGDIKLVFDATSAGAHRANWAKLRDTGVRVLDLTPASIGPFCVPVVNLDEHLDAPNLNMVTCGGQATVPIVAAVAQSGIVSYAEIVSSISAKSAGPGTRANIDEFTETTSTAMQVVGGAQGGKAVMIINPADPPVMMRNAVYCLVDGDADLPGGVHDGRSPGGATAADQVPKYSWIWRIAIDPSPTAEATRLTEPLRTSPAANTPGWLVSSIIG